MLLLVAPCSLVAMRKVVAPLNELSRTAQELASGVMDARAKVSVHNEIGDLARAFNDMAERLAGAQFEMLKLNAELEERVQQRTHQLEDLASREPLTGLYNRRYFSEVITREFAVAERYDTDLTVLMFDLDHFKETNDKFGHRAGDEVLVLVADCIRAELREADVAARFGGDEFILLLPRTSGSAAGNVAERITTRFMETLAREWPQFPTTLSIGVASLRVTRASTAEALIHEADLALYAAKTGGRNRTMAATGARS
jgi:diguanylate cyclase (GGDEF)-like protein